MKMNTEDREGWFGQFLSLGLGNELVIGSLTRDFFIEVFKELENWELFIFLFRDSELTMANAIDRLKKRRSMQLKESNEIKFIATHFHEFSSDSLVSLNGCGLSEILLSPNLQLFSEDSLCEFVMKHVQDDLSCFRYFESVRFEFLSPSTIATFVDLIQEMNSSYEVSLHLNGRIWSSIFK
jgi:hypothetical protein